MASTAHRNKRQFQPSITTFFARADREVETADDTAGAASTPRDNATATPLPSTIQASLLNVGMRVRKSVPEGYKTHKTVPAPYVATTQTTSLPAARPAGPYVSRPAELTPFCGLHKIGGHGAQTPVGWDQGDGVDLGHPVDALGVQFSVDTSEFGISSQESSTSTISNDSMPAVNKSAKRRFEDEEVEEAGQLAGACWGEGWDEQISPKSLYPVSHTAMPRLAAGGMRAMKTPKSRTGHQQGLGAGSGEGQMGVCVGTADAEADLDFGEAEFLRFDDEVEMGGV